MWKTVTVTTKTELLGERKTAAPETFDELMEEFVQLREQALRDVRDVVIDNRIRGRSLEHLQEQLQSMTERFEALSAHAARLHEAHVPVPDQYGLVHEGQRSYEHKPITEILVYNNAGKATELAAEMARASLPRLAVRKAARGVRAAALPAPVALQRNAARATDRRCSDPGHAVSVAHARAATACALAGAH